MTSTKNGTKAGGGQSEDLRLYALFAGFGLISAFAVQHAWGISEIAGSFVISAFLLLLLYKDIKRYGPKYLSKKRMLLLLLIIITGTLGLSRLSAYILLGLSKGLGLSETSAYVYGIPVAAGAMLVALLFDFHTAIMVSFVLSILMGLWLGDTTYPVFVFVGSLTAAFSVIRCRKRSAILRAGLYLVAANLAVTPVIYLFKGSISGVEALHALVFASFSGIAVAALVSILLPAFESLFNISTDISLVELLDLDHPLMKNLMVEAPGTYHHSIIVGNLVESVAERVGVNPLLARVGAYYHDIGKIRMPDYFIENSPSGKSKHDRLTPHMSSMILISHVKEGVELAKEHKLPENVIDIINQHHGASLIKYFYQKAKDAAEGGEVSEDEYKYPGPRPQSRVAAVVMLADAVEASSRVLVDPTPARISALVDKIINHIYLEGQLDQCELTLRDISEIKERFTRILTGILHKRVDYPGFDFSKAGDESGAKKRPAEDPLKAGEPR